MDNYTSNWMIFGRLFISLSILLKTVRSISAYWINFPIKKQQNRSLSQKRSFLAPLKITTICQPLDWINCPRDISRKSSRMKNTLTS